MRPGCDNCDALQRSNARLLAERDAAWARLVCAVEVRWREDIQGAAQVDNLNEIDAAKQALRDLGVDVDALLDGKEGM